MPIEVRELVIRAQINNRSSRGSETSQGEKKQEKEQDEQSCGPSPETQAVLEQVNDMIKLRNER